MSQRETRRSQQVLAGYSCGDELRAKGSLRNSAFSNGEHDRRNYLLLIGLVTANTRASRFFHQEAYLTVIVPTIPRVSWGIHMSSKVPVS